MQWVLLVLCGAVAAGATAAPRTPFRDVPAGHWAEDAIGKLAAQGVMKGTTPTAFKPEQTVTRAELAGILVRLIDRLESKGPNKISKSPAKPHVARGQREALARLPKQHPATAALKRLVEGGYLVPNVHGEYFMPTQQNLNRPVTPEELSLALAGIAIRFSEKKVGVEHPESLNEGYRLGPNDQRPIVPRGQKPHRHGIERPNGA
jgi:hypothetical protein